MKAFDQIGILCRPLQLRQLERAARQSVGAICSVIVIKDLESVVQDRLDNSGLPSSIFDVTSDTWPATVALLSHQRGSKADGKVAWRHSVLLRMLRYSVEMQCKHSQGGVVGVRERIDDGME